MSLFCHVGKKLYLRAEYAKKHTHIAMNISYKWLKDYVDFDLTAPQVSEALTSIGLEVEGLEEVQSIRGGLAGLVVGHVLTCIPHPNSDHMHICQVDLGDGAEPTQIVCGAPNVAAGQKVIVATLGTKLYFDDKEITIKKGKLRGEASNGMICAEDEIGVGTSHEGIIVLPQDTPVGMPAAEYYHLESDYLIGIGITPNRADACSHYGVARDLYAWLVQNGYETSLHRPGCEDFRVDNNDLPIEVEIENAEACPHYVALSLTDCEVKESPEWLKNRLTTIGLRPINNIVDITNYIMMAYGQPMHCFDADMVEGKKIVVKTMPEGTPFVTLDGTEHKLSDHDLAICNAHEPMCIAGVFGGKGSGTYDTTRNVVLESAFFNPTWIRKSARRHGLSTDASFRFERGIDPTSQVYAIKQAALMAKELAGAKVSMQIVDVQARELPTQFPVELSYDYCANLIGKRLPADTIKSICRSLEMEITGETADSLNLLVPAYRVDVQRPCDVVEDILRIYGYNNVEVPTNVNSTLNVKGETDRSYKLQQLVSEQLVGAGFHEIMNNSLQRGALYEGLESLPEQNCVRLLNPLSQELNVMRQTLLFGGLDTIARNISHRMPSQLLFEFGNVYCFRAERRWEGIVPGQSSSSDPEVIKHALDAYSEHLELGIWVTGKRVQGNWAHADEDTTFYELKAHVLNILQRIGLPFGAIVFAEGKSDLFQKSLAIQNRGGKTLAEMGVVSRQALKRCDVAQPVYFAALDWQMLMRAVKNQKVTFREISKYPAVSRDLALLVDNNVQFAAIESIAYQSEKKLLKEVRLFDVYEGKNLPAGKKSYAVNFTLQDSEKTMSDKAIDAIMQKLIKNLTTQLGAELR